TFFSASLTMLEMLFLRFLFLNSFLNFLSISSSSSDIAYSLTDEVVVCWLRGGCGAAFLLLAGVPFDLVGASRRILVFDEWACFLDVGVGGLQPVRLWGVVEQERVSVRVMIGGCGFVKEEEGDKEEEEAGGKVEKKEMIIYQSHIGPSPGLACTPTVPPDMQPPLPCFGAGTRTPWEHSSAEHKRESRVAGGDMSWGEKPTGIKILWIWTIGTAVVLLGNSVRTRLKDMERIMNAEHRGDAAADSTVVVADDLDSNNEVES
ncbi:hypothetical protein AKJ16_DCAP12748, partial [Drosera capensis]